jgi:hypothetical protein
MDTEAPEYLPTPAGLAARAAQLQADGHPVDTAHWMAACEALGAVARREHHHRDLFWHGDVPDEQRNAWDRIADHEGKRFYFHQKKDTLVGYLSHGRHTARLSVAMEREIVDKLREERARLDTGERRTRAELIERAEANARARLDRLYSGQVPEYVANSLAEAAIADLLNEVDILHRQLAHQAQRQAAPDTVSAPVTARWTGELQWPETELGASLHAPLRLLDGRTIVLAMDEDEATKLAATIAAALRLDVDGLAVTVWRAERGGIPLDTYTAREDAQAHCRDDHRAEHGDGTDYTWYEDQEDPDRWVMWVKADNGESSTGFRVVPVTVLGAYGGS